MPKRGVSGVVAGVYMGMGVNVNPHDGWRMDGLTCWGIDYVRD
jgi:hypothetical protein